jgi:peroxiredoxin
VAASEKAERAGSEQYHENHMGAIFKEGFSFSGYERDFLTMNMGDGTFLNISGVSGVDSISDGRGSVFADFDNDGDLDIFLTTAQREAHYLYRNNVGNLNGFVRLELEGTNSGRDAFGALIRVKSSIGVQTKLLAGGSGFLSQHDTRPLFGLGADERAEWVEVVWPDGVVQRIEDVRSGQTLRLVQGSEAFVTVDERRIELVDPLDPHEAFLSGLGFRRGEPLPDLNLFDIDGEAVRLDGIVGTGRPVLVNFWATWCGPCAKEMPELQRMRSSFRDAGIDLIGISVDLDTKDAVAGYVEARGVDYPIYTTDEAALESLYPSGEATVPLTLLLDGDGRVAQVHSGWSDESAKALNELASGR